MSPPSPASRDFVRVVLLLGLLASFAACDSPPGTSSPSDDVDTGAPSALERPTGQDRLRNGDSRDMLRLVDDAGSTVTLPAPPRRIVSLVPSAAQILLALDAEDRLVGRTDFDTLPALSSLPSVGGGLNPNPERLVDLEPDLVIRFGGPTDPDTPERLDRIGIPHLAVRPDGIDDVRRIVRLLGRVVGRAERAESLVARMDSALSDVRRRVEPFPARPVAFVLDGSPPWVAGPGTFIDELVRLAGGRNAFSDLERLYGPVSEELFVTRAIDLVLTTSSGTLDFLPPGLRVERVPRNVETPGLDLAASAEILARAIHPEAYP